MILVDTNILIEYFRSRDSEIAKKLDSMSVAICGPVKTEILHGARTDEETDRILKAFSVFELFTVDEYDWEFSGIMLQQIRKSGISIPITDALIAYLAIKYDILLWTMDHHFKLIQAVYPELKLYE